MKKLPVIVTTSVIRTAHKGESHGGIYLVDLENETVKQVFDWNDTGISWDGRGGERGMRGISFYNGYIVTASSSEIIFFNQKFNIVNTVKNNYLKGIHEIDIKKNILYVTSTSYDAILTYDLNNQRFITGYKFEPITVKSPIIRIYRPKNKLKIGLKRFDPNKIYEVKESDLFHINMVSVHNDTIFFCGTRIEDLMYIKNNKITASSKVSLITHNCQPYKDGIIFNNTGDEKVTFQRNNKMGFDYTIPKYSDNEILNANLPNDYAKQAFGRGLCFYEDYIISGSSPATITVYDINSKKIVKTINISNDVRNAIHGLEVYPY